MNTPYTPEDLANLATRPGYGISPNSPSGASKPLPRLPASKRPERLQSAKQPISDDLSPPAFDGIEGRWFVIRGIPYPKPRMTQQDKWLNPPRDPVARYRAWENVAREALHVATGSVMQTTAVRLDLTFYLPMPKSWSQKKQARMEGKAHGVKPDLDNLIKGIGDALVLKDQTIYEIRAKKRWEDFYGPRVEVTLY